MCAVQGRTAMLRQGAGVRCAGAHGALGPGLVVHGRPGRWRRGAAPTCGRGSPSPQAGSLRLFFALTWHQ